MVENVAGSYYCNRAEDQQIRNRNKHHSKDSLSNISNCVLTLDVFQARLLGVGGGVSSDGGMSL